MSELAPEPRIVATPADPMAVARQFVTERYLGTGGVSLLRHHRGDFYRYAEDHWPADDERRVRSELYRWLEPACFWKPRNGGDPELVPFRPNTDFAAFCVTSETALRIASPSAE